MYLEKQKVKNLEQAQGGQDDETNRIKSNTHNEYESMEVQLTEANDMRSLVTGRESNFHAFVRLEEGERSVVLLERSVWEREELLQVEIFKFATLFRELANIQTELDEDRRHAKSKQEEAFRLQALLEVEQDTAKDLQQMVDQAKIALESMTQEIAQLKDLLLNEKKRVEEAVALKKNSEFCWRRNRRKLST